MKRNSRAPAKSKAVKKPPAPQGDGAQFERRALDGRNRLQLAARTLKELFGIDPVGAKAWRRGVYLSLMGRVFLMLLESELSPQELKCLSAILADQRRSQPRGAGGRRRVPTKGAQHDGAPSRPDGRPLFAGLGPVVKGLYDLNMGTRSNRSGDPQTRQSDEDDGDQKD